MGAAEDSAGDGGDGLSARDGHGVDGDQEPARFFTCRFGYVHGHHYAYEAYP